MSRFYLAFAFLVALTNFNLGFAQAPNISYATPQVYALNTTITPLAPANTGGAVPPTIYGQTNTFAGSGSQGSTNGAGTVASFYKPYGSCIDASGNIYVADTYNHLIRKITPAKVVSTFAGSGSPGLVNATGTSASFNNPGGLGIDASGNIYVGDQTSNAIRKITPAGVVSTLAGSSSPAFANGTGTAASFNSPAGIALDGSGNVYVADRTNNMIRKITPAGVVTTFAGDGSTGNTNGPGASASFNNPTGVAVDANGNVFVADQNNYLIRKITPAGVVSTLAGSGTQGATNGLATAASFDRAFGVAVDQVGNVYVADEFNQLVREITPAGYVNTLAGSGSVGAADGIGVLASFNYPAGMVSDGAGNLYVTETGGDKIRKLVTTGYVIDKLLPAGLVFDPTTGIISGKPTVTSPVTTYVVTAYNAAGSSTTTVTISIVSLIAQTINFPPLGSKVYGTSDFAPGATASSGLPVSYTSSNTAVATITSGSNIHIVGVGTTNITASQNGNATYGPATPVTQTLTVSPAPLTITADNKTKAYGTANPVLTYTYSGFVNGETSAVLTSQPTITTTATASSGAGNYPITTTGAAAANYAITNVPGVLTITQVPLTITADDQVKPYGQPNPVLTYTYSGFVNGDGPTSMSSQPTPQTTATTTSPLGNYPIIISGAVNPNYAITYVPGTLSIRIAQTITTFAPPPTKVYGAADFTLTASANSGLPVSFAGSNNAIATVTPAGVIHITGVGTITITASQGGNTNYAPAPQVTQPFTVIPAPLTITADNLTKVYNTANPALTYTYTGFVYGETSTVLITQPTISTTATATSNAGTYPITTTGATAANYTITYNAGILTVTPALRTLTFNAIPAKTYGDADFNAGATITTNEAITYTSSNPAVATIVNGQVHIVGAGTASITASVAANPNYNAVAPITQPLIVNKASQVITFNPIPDQRKGDPDITLVVSASSGLPVTVTSSDPLKAPITGLTVKLLDIGLIVFTATQAGDNNYLPATATQTLRIDKMLPDLVLIHQLVTPNGDGINDVLMIDGIDKYPNNKFTLTTRNGVKIYEVDGYDNAGKGFVGYSNITGSLQQQGTYFYSLQFVAAGVIQKRVGFIVLKY
jgi:sugar lactone lactonase YvrE